MRIVMVYHISDGCTFSYTETLPLNYQSCEAASVDFEKLVRETKANNGFDFTFAGHAFNYYDFLAGDHYAEPGFFTVDEWFESCAR